MSLVYLEEGYMTRGEFNKLFNGLIKDSRDGYFGYEEIKDEIWYYFNNEQMRNKDLWKEVQKLRKKLGIER